MRDHVRVESAIVAESSGDLTWERWPIDSVIAHGLAGIRNPLGFAMDRFLSNSCTPNVWEVTLVLTTRLILKGVDKADAKVAAEDAFLFWRDMHCPICHGRGITGITQQPCMPCNGTGDRELPFGPDSLRLAIGELIEAEAWMEGQLAARLRGAKYQTTDDGGNKVHLPALSGVQDSGFNSNANTGFSGRFDSD